MARSSIAIITSPTLIPAISAGLPGSTLVTRAPAFAALATRTPRKPPGVAAVAGATVTTTGGPTVAGRAVAGRTVATPDVAASGVPAVPSVAITVAAKVAVC